MKSSTVVDDEQVLGLQVQVESLIKERNELEKRVNELENKMGFNDDEGTKVIIVELNERIIGLNAQIEEQRQTITSLTEDIETYQQTILLLQEEYENAQEQLREHLEEDDEVEKKPQRDSKNIRELKEQLDKANRELEETKQELKATQELLDEEITQPKGKVTDGDTMGDSDKDEEIFLLKQQIEQLSNDCAAFQRVLSNTRTKYEEQIDELTEQLQLYQKGDEKVSSIWQKRYQLLDNEKNEEIRKMEENMVLLKEEYSSEIKELNSLVANLQNDSDNYQRTISIVKETYQNQISELTQRLESKAQITSEYRELKSVEAEKETLEKMLSDSKEKYQEEKLINDQTVSNLRQIVRDMEDDAKNQQQALDLLHERVQELEDDATAYQRALMSMKLGYEEQLQQAQEELESLRENAQMSDQKDSSQIAVKSDSKEELANLRRQNNMLISKTKDMEAYERMMSSLRKEVEDLKKESQKHAARADEFTEKYAKVKEERAKSEEIYQKDITKLKAQLSSLQLSNEERTETTGPQNGARQPDTKRFINLENKVRMLSTELANERSLAKLTQNTLQKRYESQVEVLRSKLQTAEAQMQEISQEMLRERREMEEQMRKMMESSRMLSGKKQDRRENLREIQKGTPVKQGELSDEMGAQEISLMRQGYEQRIKSLNTQLATYMDLEKKHKEEIEELRRSYEAKISAISRYVTPTETPSLETPQDDSDSTQTPLKTSGKYSRPLPRGRRTGGGFTAQRRQFEDTIRKLETEVAALKRKLAEAKPETEDSQQALALELFSGVGNTQFVPRVFEKRKEAKPNPDPSVPMKNLNWSRISNARVEKTIWNNLSDQEVQINKSALEAAFRSTSSGETTSTKSGQTTTSAQTSRSKSKSQTVTILSPKRSEAIALMLSGLQISFLGIKEAVLSLDDAALTTDQLILLRQNAPKVSEIEALEEFQHLSPTRFGKAEQFFLQIRHIPRFSARIQAWICERTFADKIQNICSLADDVIAACKEIQESEKFSAVLSTILAVGNYMNGGTHKGGAYGFRVSTLVKLNQIRGTGSFPTLLHFVVNLVKTNQPQNVSFSEQIPHISGAAKASGKFISTEVNEMTKDLKIVGLEIENCAGESTGEVFKTRMLKFFANASKQHREMVEKVKLMEDTFNSTAVFFGEEIENSDPAKFFTAINIFISAFDRIAAGKSQEVKPRSQTKFFKKQGNVGVVDGLINSLKSGRISKQWN
ncbi:protein diaphanous [Anaeramoeba ignava]|uniref:Protein diaphanous n=1 Tax=Anaeramoeba ignava TaxID=1746090 RepID=A0A9Q0RCX7_ANAIG|nr:protein diaphanous [Anaeramoeba ignava]